MSLKRKLAAGGAVALLVAGGATGAGLAASGQGAGPKRVAQVRLASTTRAAFVRASAAYLGTEVASLRREVASGRTLADVANATPGRSAKQLVSLLVAAAGARLELVADRPLSRSQQRSLHVWLRRRITGFLNDTCPLSLSGLGKHLGGCAGMKM